MILRPSLLLTALATLACTPQGSGGARTGADGAPLTDALAGDAAPQGDGAPSDEGVAPPDGAAVGDSAPLPDSTAARDATSPVDGAPPVDGATPDQDAASVDAGAASAIVADPGAELALLFVGNSYVASNNLPSVVCELAEQTGRWAEVRCESVTAGGKRLAQHEADAEAGRRLGQWLDPVNPERPDWDAVVLQEQSQIPGFPPQNAEQAAFRQAVVSLNARIAAIGAETALLMTWGRRDGDEHNPELYPDYPTMQRRLADGYLGAARDASSLDRTVHVLPAGQGWSATWQRDPEGDFRALYSGDGSHPALPGSYLTAVIVLDHLVGADPTAFAPLERGPEAALAERVRADAATVSP